MLHVLEGFFYLETMAVNPQDTLAGAYQVIGEDIPRFTILWLPTADNPLECFGSEPLACQFDEPAGFHTDVERCLAFAQASDKLLGTEAPVKDQLRPEPEPPSERLERTDGVCGKAETLPFLRPSGPELVLAGHRAAMGRQPVAVRGLHQAWDSWFALHQPEP